MPPESNQESFPPTTSSNPQQSIYIIRHGDRWDYLHPEWKKTAERKGDPSLSSLGHEQARQAGKYLDQLFVTEEIDTDQINLLSSPFLRTIQTSNELLSELKHTANDNATTNDNVNDNDNGITTAADSIKIQPEHSIFELDLWGQNLHSSLPEMQERQCYFPRIDGEYESMFLPSLPETKEQFFERCDLAMEHISRAFPYDDEKNRVIILVTHAACCIGLVKAGTGVRHKRMNLLMYYTCSHRMAHLTHYYYFILVFLGNPGTNKSSSSLFYLQIDENDESK